jgi:hypothetical protein
MIMIISIIINRIGRWHGICFNTCLTLIKEVKMRVRQIFTLIGIVLILTGGIVFADYPGQVRNRNQVNVGTKPQNKLLYQYRMMFVDENGDGICDGLRDHDNDGIPNGQDPDWTKSQDGTGNQFKKGFGGQDGNGNGNGNRNGNRNGNQNQNSGNQFGNKNEFRGGNGWDKQSFRQNRIGVGSSVCDSTGPKGNARKGGKR